MDTEDLIRLIGELTERVSGLSSLDQMLYLDTVLWLPDDVHDVRRGIGCQANLRRGSRGLGLAGPFGGAFRSFFGRVAPYTMPAGRPARECAAQFGQDVVCWGAVGPVTDALTAAAGAPEYRVVPLIGYSSQRPASGLFHFPRSLQYPPRVARYVKYYRLPWVISREILEKDPFFSPGQKPPRCWADNAHSHACQNSRTSVRALLFTNCHLVRCLQWQKAICTC